MAKITLFFQKAASFCAYQERCISEVQEKLEELVATAEEINTTIEELIREKYLDEERFAQIYAGSKFRTKKWGKLKIKYMLKQKKVPTNLINKGLSSINGEEYYETIKALALQKKQELRDKFTKAKVYNYLIAKGFESDLVQMAINEVEEF
jgi:regulatory protein